MYFLILHLNMLVASPIILSRRTEIVINYIDIELETKKKMKKAKENI